MALIDKLIAIGDAIRRKTGKSGKLTLEQMVTEIDEIAVGSSDVLSQWTGLNPVKVAEYDETYSLADTTFSKGSETSTSAKTIKATTANRFTTPTISIGDKDILVIQKTHTVPTHESGATDKGRQIKHAYLNIGLISKRKTSDTSGNTTRQVHALSTYMNNYYNSNAVNTRGVYNYGFYAAPQNPTVASTTSANTTVRVGSPILYYRIATAYESQANINMIEDVRFRWHADVYLVDAGSSMGRVANDVLDDVLVNGL